VSWRGIGALSDGLDWVANGLGPTVIDRKSCTGLRVARGGLDLNGKGKMVSKITVCS
jgi:hypothetical protein